MTGVFLEEEGKKQGLDHDNLINSTSASPVPNDEEIRDFLATFNFDPNEKLPESTTGGRRRRKSKRKKQERSVKRKDAEKEKPEEGKLSFFNFIIKTKKKELKKRN